MLVRSQPNRLATCGMFAFVITTRMDLALAHTRAYTTEVVL